MQAVTAGAAGFEVQGLGSKHGGVLCCVHRTCSTPAASCAANALRPISLRSVGKQAATIAGGTSTASPLSFIAHTLTNVGTGQASACDMRHATRLATLQPSLCNTLKPCLTSFPSNPGRQLQLLINACSELCYWQHGVGGTPLHSKHLTSGSLIPRPPYLVAAVRATAAAAAAAAACCTDRGLS